MLRFRHGCAINPDPPPPTRRLATTSLCASAGSKAPEPAPRFRAKTTNGQQFNNESIKGKVVLFEFWTTWCKYCVEEASMVDDVAREFAPQGLIVLAVDVLESDKVVQKYVAEHPRSVPSCSPKTPTSPPCTTRKAIRFTS